MFSDKESGLVYLYEIMESGEMKELSRVECESGVLKVVKFPFSL